MMLAESVLTRALRALLRLRRQLADLTPKGEPRSAARAPDGANVDALETDLREALAEAAQSPLEPWRTDGTQDGDDG